MLWGDCIIVPSGEPNLVFRHVPVLASVNFAPRWQNSPSGGGEISFLSPRIEEFAYSLLARNDTIAPLHGDDVVAATPHDHTSRVERYLNLHRLYPWLIHDDLLNEYLGN